MTKTKVLSKKTAANIMQWLNHDVIWDCKDPDYDGEFLLEEIESFQDMEYTAKRIATRIFDISPNFSSSDYDELKQICGPDLFELAIRYYVTSEHDT